MEEAQLLLKALAPEELAGVSAPVPLARAGFQATPGSEGGQLWLSVPGKGEKGERYLQTQRV